MQGQRERNKQDKLLRIRQATWGLFQERGYEGTTTRAIAERAGIGTGTLFLYAKDKSDLLFLIFREELARIADRGFATLPRDLPLCEALTHVFSGFYCRYEEIPDLGRRFVSQILTLKGERKASYDELNAGFFARLTLLLEERKLVGEVDRNLPSPLFALNLFAIYGLHVLTWLDQPDPRAQLGLETLHLMFAVALDGARPHTLPEKPRAPRPQRPSSRTGGRRPRTVPDTSRR